MRLSEKILIFLFIIVFILFGYIISETLEQRKDCQNVHFYDGEGNEIPREIVQLEVKNHFIKLTRAQKDSINKYFYLDSLQ